VSEQLTELIQTLVEPHLKHAIRVTAFNKERSVSAEIRETLRRVYLADRVTLEQAEADPGVMYTAGEGE
jgi:plasmid stability protein